MITCLMLALSVLQAEPVRIDLRCGGYCLYVSLKGLGFPVASYAELEGRLGQPTAAGYSMAELKSVAESYGAHTMGVKTSIENLRKRRGRLAIIALLDSSHYVNIAECGEDSALLLDPPAEKEIPLVTLEHTWSGEALLVSAEPLVPEEELSDGLVGYWAAIALLVVASLGVLILGRRMLRVRTGGRSVAKGATLSLAFLCLVMAGCGQEEVRIQASGQPSIEMGRHDVDLGMIQGGSDVVQTARFEFRNVGTAPLRIGRVTTSCVCVSASLDRSVVAVGDRGELTVEVDPTKSDAQEGAVTLECNDPLNSPVVLWVRWKVSESWSIEPRVIDFGTIRSGESVVAVLEVAQGESCPEDCVKSAVDSSPPEVVAAWAEGPVGPELAPAEGQDSTVKDGIVEEPSGQRRYLQVVVTPDVDASGERVGTVRFQFSGCLRQEWHVPVRWTAVPVISITPSTVFGTVVRGADPRPITLLVQAAHPHVVEVGAVRLEPELKGSQIDVTRRSDAEVSIVLHFPPGDSAGVVEARLIVDVVEPVARQFAVPVWFNVRDPDRAGNEESVQ
jgi:hypothetical protein